MKKIIGVDGVCGMCNGRTVSAVSDVKGYEMKQCQACGHKIYKVVDARWIIRDKPKR